MAHRGRRAFLALLVAPKVPLDQSAPLALSAPSVPLVLWVLQALPAPPALLGPLAHRVLLEAVLVAGP